MDQTEAAFKEIPSKKCFKSFPNTRRPRVLRRKPLPSWGGDRASGFGAGRVCGRSRQVAGLRRDVLVDVIRQLCFPVAHGGRMLAKRRGARRGAVIGSRACHMTLVIWVQMQRLEEELL